MLMSGGFKCNVRWAAVASRAYGVLSHVLLIDVAGVSGFAMADKLIDKAPSDGEIVEVARAAPQRHVFDRLLKMVVPSIATPR